MRVFQIVLIILPLLFRTIANYYLLNELAGVPEKHAITQG